jgi:hypothetical protein
VTLAASAVRVERRRVQERERASLAALTRARRFGFAEG